MKFVPVTARVNCPPPARTGFGLSAVIAGVGFGGGVTCRMAAADVPPPGVGVNTVMLAAPGLGMFAEVILAVNCVALPNVVGRLLPLIRTTDELTKPLPVTIRSKSGLPACTVVGLIIVMRGIGFGVAMVKSIVFEGPPPGDGLTTRTVAAPAA